MPIRALSSFVNPWTERKYKVNTYLIESCARNKALDALQFWFGLKAVDVERHLNPTGKLFGINDVCKRIAFKFGCSTKTALRYLRKAEANGLVFLDYDLDFIYIRSRVRATFACRQSEANRCDQEGFPDAHTQRLGDIREISVTLPEIRSKYRATSHARILSITRQHITERGWGRDSLAKLVGQTRRATSRVDANQNIRRGYQHAVVPLKSLIFDKSANLEEVGKKIAASYHNRWEVTEGNGKKLWYGTYNDMPVLFTQLPVKYDTVFRGRLRLDRDVLDAVKSSGDLALTAECWSLQPVFAEHGRDSESSRGEGIIGESTKQSVFRAIRSACGNLGLSFNPKPAILVVDGTTWALKSFGTHESSNQSTPLTLKKSKKSIEQNAFESP